MQSIHLILRGGDVKNPSPLKWKIHHLSKSVGFDADSPAAMSCMTIHHHWAESACMLIEDLRPSVYAQFLWMTSKSWEKQLSGESTDSPDNCFKQPSQGSVVPVYCLPCFQVAYIAHSPGTMTSSAFVHVKMFGCHVGNAWMAKIQENIARRRHVLERQGTQSCRVNIFLSTKKMIWFALPRGSVKITRHL